MYDNTLEEQEQFRPFFHYPSILLLCHHRQLEHTFVEREHMNDALARELRYKMW